MRTMLLFAVISVFLMACAPVMPATEMPEPAAVPERPEIPGEPAPTPDETEKMPPSVSAEPGAEPPMEPIMFQPSGEVLVDGITKYIEYNVADFEKAKSEGRIVFIEFHAFWCPFCQRLDPIIQASLADLDDPDVVGFRADFDKDKALRREYNVIIQHTHLIITPDGEEAWRSFDTQWPAEIFKHEIEKAKGE